MRPFTLQEWQTMYEACPIPTKYNVADGDFLVTRIENTQFSIARHFGSVMVGGKRYVYVAAVAGNGRDGGELIVRDDFLKWVEDEGRKLLDAKRRQSAPVQQELF